VFGVNFCFVSSLTEIDFSRRICHRGRSVTSLGIQRSYMGVELCILRRFVLYGGRTRVFCAVLCYMRVGIGILCGFVLYVGGRTILSKAGTYRVEDY